MSKKLTKKALLQKAKARLTGDESTAAEMFLLAHKLGIKSGKIEFSGSGDDGDYYDPEYEGGEDPKITDASGNWVPNPKYGEDYQLLDKMVQETAENWVQSAGVDWYNNEGGGGNVAFDFKTGGVTGYIFQYEQVEHEAASGEWNLLEDKEEGDE